MKLSIVAPAHNEEQRIVPFLDVYTAYFDARYGSDYELIAVINGSTDLTEQIVRDYAGRAPQMKVIVEPASVGKGGALVMGLERAAGELVGYVDADGATPPEAFQDLVEHIGDAGAIIASRWIKGAVVSPRQPLARRVASRIFNFLVRRLFRVKIWDTQCGAKLMRREALRKVLPDLRVTRWAFDVDLLFQLRRAGYRIVEWPTVWHDKSGSQLRVARASAEMFVAIVRLRLLYSPLRWVVALYDRTVGRVVPIEKLQE
ncbi:MAG: glycosyltransferase family 2 protein [Kiritimatiellae bacterium]|nr:glycosyltransferase family 2 protein [Kiritimatiellia bacterium]